MDLLHYLSQHFYTKSQLLEHLPIDACLVSQYQREGLMPQPSYRLSLNLQCESSFGRHDDFSHTEYYAKGYVSWLGLVHASPDKVQLYTEFSNRYITTLNALKAEGFAPTHSKLNSGLVNHINEEWQYFIDGTYGLCTASGLPEDIAAKECAIVIIEELTALTTLSAEQRTALEQAVNLLDSSSALFAPHERDRSSRHRLIDEVRTLYQLDRHIVSEC